MNITAYRTMRPFWRNADVVLETISPRGRLMQCIVGSGLIFGAWWLSGLSANFVMWALVTLVGTAGLALLWLACQPHQPERLLRWWDSMPGFVRWRGWRTLIVLFLLYTTWGAAAFQFQQLAVGSYPNDAIAYVHMDADLLARGRNPYTADDAFWEAARRWPEALATPILDSVRFGANPRHYPLGKHINTILQFETANPTLRDNSFDPATVHNYPAGIIWLALPLVYAGLPSVVWLNFLAFFIMFGLLIARSPTKLRGAVAVAILANPLIPLFTLYMNFDLICYVFLVGAWLTMPRERASGLLLGVACAVKQLAWFFAPFYLIEVARREGIAAAARRAVWCGLAFLLPNLPFIIQSPQAWLHSILIPLQDSMFPLGFGPITLALGGGLPLLAPHLWTALEMGVFVALLAFQWFRPRVTSDGLFLGPVPLWFSWRSALNYFAVMPLAATYLAAQAEIAAETQHPATPAPVLPWPDIIDAPAVQIDTPDRELAGIS